MTKLKLGICGTGFISEWHYNGFNQNPDTEITGICRNFHGTEKEKENQRARLNQKAKELNLKSYTDFEQMVSDPSLDAVIIGSINPYHLGQIKLAAENGKHMMVEKPVVTSIEDVDLISDISRKYGVKIFPAHNFVYRNAVQKARNIIDQNELGQIIHSSFVITHTIGKDHATGWRSKKDLGTGGTLIDSGHHLVYQSLYLMGMPVSLGAYTSKMLLKNMDCEDTAQVSMKYKDGSMGVIMQSWTSDHAGMINGIRIFGTKGSLVISDGLYVNDELIDKDVDYGDSFKNQARAFSDYLLNDTPPLSGLEDVKNTLKITFGAYESNDHEKIIRL